MNKLTHHNLIMATFIIFLILWKKFSWNLRIKRKKNMFLNETNAPEKTSEAEITNYPLFFNQPI